MWIEVTNCSTELVYLSAPLYKICFSLVSFFFKCVCFDAKLQGHFQILSMSGSCTFTSGAAGGAERKIGMLSVSLAKPDGVVFGGGVESSLIAATPIQVRFFLKTSYTRHDTQMSNIKRLYLTQTLTQTPTLNT